MIVFNYDMTQLEDGHYVVDVTQDGHTKRTIAEYTKAIDLWEQIGMDYDTWQTYITPKVMIQVIARVHLDKLMIVEVVE